MAAFRYFYEQFRPMIVFVAVDMTIYFLTILLYVVARLSVSPKNFKRFQVADWLLIVATLINSFTGAKAFYSEKMTALLKNDHSN